MGGGGGPGGMSPEEKQQMIMMLMMKIKELQGEGGPGAGGPPMGGLGEAYGLQVTKENVLHYLMAEGMAANVVSAEAMFNHMSDRYLCIIEDNIVREHVLSEAGRNPAHPYETEEQAEAQSDRRAGKKNREGNKVANKKGPIPDTEGSNTAN